MNYAQQMKHPLWQRKRLEVLELADFQCSSCGTKEETLHVHHPVYRRGAMIWEYEADELQCLCDSCHKEAHAIDERLKKSLALLGTPSKLQALGYIDSMLSPYLEDESSEYADGFADRFRGNTKWIVRQFKK